MVGIYLIKMNSFLSDILSVLESFSFFAYKQFLIKSKCNVDKFAHKDFGLAGEIFFLHKVSNEHPSWGFCSCSLSFVPEDPWFLCLFKVLLFTLSAACCGSMRPLFLKTFLT